MGDMHMNRLMFIRIEEKDKSEIFKNLWHSVGYYIFALQNYNFFLKYASFGGEICLFMQI